MRTLKLTIAYDGTDFCRLAAAGLERTVQAVDRRRAGADRGAAGRHHRRGSHRRGRACRWSGGERRRSRRRSARRRLQRALNATLPHDVRVLRRRRDAPDFNARFDARLKTYRYALWCDRRHAAAAAPLCVARAAAAGCERHAGGRRRCSSAITTSRPSRRQAATS